MSLKDESEIELSLRPGLIRQNCSWGAVGVAVDQSICSSVLTLPPLLLQEDGKRLYQHARHSVVTISP
jgi:hypothetical protein